MTDNELLLSISDLMDKKLKPLESRMDSFDRKIDTVEQNLKADINRLDVKIDAVEQNLKSDINRLDVKIDAMEQNLKSDINRLDVKIDAVEQNLKSDINRLDSSIHMINLKLENIIEPRLNEIESCYLSTFERYKIGNEKFEKIETDLSILKSVITEHNEKLQSQIA